MKSSDKEFFYYFRVWVFSVCFQLFQLCFFWLPVKRNRVMVYVHQREGFTCNPKYIVLELQKEYGDRLEIIWVTMYPETCEEVRKLEIPVIRRNSLKHMLLYLRTHFLISDDSFPSWAVRRPGQKWMNTWHGAMNYKRIGYYCLPPLSLFEKAIFYLENRQPDFFLSGSAFFTQNTAASFDLQERVFLPTGLPRNDILLSGQRVDKIHAKYSLDTSQHICLFAPTFRKNTQSDTFGLQFSLVRQALAEKFGGDWVILFRNHNFVKGEMPDSEAIDASSYHDMQELLCAADVLISDYSSCMYDYCLTGRPVFVYAPDLPYYVKEDRDFAYPVEKWPYPMAYSNAELIENILHFDADTYQSKVNAHLKETCSYDKGTASSQVAELIADICL